jgi:hypothetical protein
MDRMFTVNLKKNMHKHDNVLKTGDIFFLGERGALVDFDRGRR